MLDDCTTKELLALEYRAVLVIAEVCSLLDSTNEVDNTAVSFGALLEMFGLLAETKGLEDDITDETRNVDVINSDVLLLVNTFVDSSKTLEYNLNVDEAITLLVILELSIGVRVDDPIARVVPRTVVLTLLLDTVSVDRLVLRNSDDVDNIENTLEGNVKNELLLLTRVTVVRTKLDIFVESTSSTSDVDLVAFTASLVWFGDELGS
jgi:hypothetical protein